MQKETMKIGYARCSTDEQNLDLQMDALKSAGCDQIFVDQGVSGAKIERDGPSKALDAVMQENSVLVVWKLGQHKAGFQSLTESIDTTTSGGKLVFHMMGALAEFERSLISERTKEGMKAAKRRGKNVGRPPALLPEQIAHARQEIEAGRETRSGMAAILGVDRTTLGRALQK